METPDNVGVEERSTAGHTTHWRQLLGSPGHGSLLQDNVTNLNLLGGHQTPAPALLHLHTDT